MNDAEHINMVLRWADYIEKYGREHVGVWERLVRWLRRR